MCSTTAPRPPACATATTAWPCASSLPHEVGARARHRRRRAGSRAGARGVRPAPVSYGQPLAAYRKSIDPTTPDAQSCDHGSPCRAAIFAVDDAQPKAALASRDAPARSKPFAGPIVTPIERAGPFYPAETYHQDCCRKNPIACRFCRTTCGRDRRLRQLWGPSRD